MPRTIPRALAAVPGRCPPVPFPSVPVDPAILLYDEQCELCQAGVSWVSALDRDGRVRCLALQGLDLAALDPRLDPEACLRELHVVTAEGEILAGWDGISHVLGLLRGLRPVAAATRRWPVLDRAGRALTRAVTTSRWDLLGSRGHRGHLDPSARRRGALSAFWVCYTAEMFLRLPLVVAATARQLGANTSDWARTRGRQVSLLDGRLTICFLTGAPTALVPLAFGERFTVAVYDGVAVDPGSSRMRRSLARHVDSIGTDLRAVIATHAHEEHVGNLDWLADRAGAEVRASPATAALLQPPYRVPLGRRLVIGAIPPLRRWRPIGDEVTTGTGHLEVLPAPGHTLDHIVLFDPDEGVLLAGDSFMGETFATPNADVDADRWIATLERLCDLDVTVLVEAHGHVHTLREDIPGIAGVVVRRDPEEAIRAKLDNLRWLRAQVEAGRREGLSDRAIEATCYPWGPQWSWERKGLDELARLFTRGRFSRTQVVRSFQRRNDDDVFPDLRAVSFAASGDPGT